jgi:carboxymethylenebutenolidase
MAMLARRTLLTSLVQVIAGLPLAAVLAEPRLARAAAGLDAVSLTTPSGARVAAALAVPAVTPAPAVLLVHEWWGLNDRIKSVAAALADEGYLALAVDLYDGKVATAPDVARSYMQQVKPNEATETLAAWIDWLRSDPRATGRIGAVGWSFGGGWSLEASLARPLEATVVYYGRVDKTPDQLAPLANPVLGHFATRDGWITPQIVSRFEKAMDAAGKTYQSHWYEAAHGFDNPASARYAAADAALAWQRTLAFLKKNLQ